MSHIKVKQTIFMKSNCGYVDDVIKHEARFANIKHFEKYCKELTRNMNDKKRKFVAIGFGSDACIVKISDIESIHYTTEII